MEIPLVVGGLISVAILAIFVGVGRALEPPASDRLEDYLGDQSARMGAQAARHSSGLGASTGELVQGFDKILRSISAADRLGHALRRAGLRLTVTEYLLIWLLSIVAAALAGYVISGSWLPAIMTGLFGVLLPYLFLKFREAGRLRAFNNQLGNVLMQLSGSLRAGYGMLQAIDFVAHQMPAPAGPEFALVVRDVKLGRGQMDALDDLAERIESDDLTLVVTAIRIHHETGGNLAEILETVSETIRERVRIKGELRSLTAQQRFSGYALAALPVIVFFVLMLLNPEYESRLFAPGPTLCIPFCAIFSMLLGFLAIRHIVSIEV
ncbi:MAG: type II secretion system F family protein [Anaerolineae bacterium]